VRRSRATTSHQGIYQSGRDGGASQSRGQRSLSQLPGCDPAPRGEAAPRRTLKVTAVAAGLRFPHAAQAIAITRRTRPLPAGKWRTVTVYAITSLTAAQASPADLAGWIRGHWRIEALHHTRDVTYGQDHSQARTGNGPQVMASLRNLAIGILKLTGTGNIAAACRRHGSDATRTLATLGLTPA
jgi:Transposase DDE domain